MADPIGGNWVDCHTPAELSKEKKGEMEICEFKTFVRATILIMEKKQKFDPNLC